MKEIREIYEVVKPAITANRSLIYSNKDPFDKTLYDKFFEILNDENVTSDSDACMILYGKKSCGSFRILKARVKDKLLKSLYNLNLREKDMLDMKSRWMYENSRTIHAIKILRLFGKRKSVIHLAKASLTKAIELQQYDNVIFLASKLRYLSSMDGDKKLFQYYDQILEEYQTHQRNVLNAEKAYLNFQVEVVRVRKSRPKIAALAHQKANQLEELLNQSPFHEIGVNYYSLRNFAFQTEGKLVESNKVLDKWYKFLELHKNLSWESSFAEVLINKINNSIYLKDLAGGEDSAKETFALLTPGLANWYVAQENYFLLLMHTRQFLKANDVVIDSLMHKNFAKQRSVRQERWLLYEAYSNFALRSFENEMSIEIPMNKLNKKLKILNKDKEGMNINYYLLEILLSFNEADNFLLLNKQEALKQYSQSHLKGPENLRSRTFIKMLISINTYVRDYKMLKSKNANNLKALKSNRYGSGPTAEMHEIIPYDMLWEWIMEKLGGGK